MRLIFVSITALLLIVGCTPFASEDEGEAKNKKVPVTIKVLNKEGSPIPDATVTIRTEMGRPLEPGQQPIAPFPIARLSDRQGEVAEELKVGEEYNIEVYTEEKAITVPDHPITVTITVKGR